MDRACYKFFSRAALAQNEHSTVIRADFVDQLADPLHFLRGTNQFRWHEFLLQERWDELEQAMFRAFSSNDLPDLLG